MERALIRWRVVTKLHLLGRYCSAVALNMSLDLAVTHCSLLWLIWCKCCSVPRCPLGPRRHTRVAAGAPLVDSSINEAGGTSIITL